VFYLPLIKGIGNSTRHEAAEEAAAAAYVREFHGEYASVDHRKHMAQYGLAALRLRTGLLAQSLGDSLGACHHVPGGEGSCLPSQRPLRV